MKKKVFRERYSIIEENTTVEKTEKVEEKKPTKRGKKNDKSDK